MYQKQQPYEEHEALYSEFMTYMKGGDKKKNLHCCTEMKYKCLHSELQKDLASKRKQIEAAKDRENKIKYVGCKFQRIEGYKEFNGSKSSFIRE